MTSLKIKNINLLDPVPYVVPEKTPIMDLEIKGEENIKIERDENKKSVNYEDGQTEIEF